MFDWLSIRDANPKDAAFLSRCIMAAFHLYNFDSVPSDAMSEVLARIEACERRKTTLYSYTNTRIAEVNGVPAGALLSYPGEEYLRRKEKTFREFWPEYFDKFADDAPETDPGEYYLDSLAVHPMYRRMGVGTALLRDGIRKGLEMGYSRIALVADSEYPHLVKLYKSLGFIPEEKRRIFGIVFQRMIYTP